MANIKCTDCKNFYCEKGQLGQPMLVFGCKLQHWHSAKDQDLSIIEQCRDHEKQYL